jgi:hypothetical protein
MLAFLNRSKSYTVTGKAMCALALSVSVVSFISTDIQSHWSLGMTKTQLSLSWYITNTLSTLCNALCFYFVHD